MIKENTYFEGGVKSLGFNQQDGDSSVGVMVPGEYTFGTGAAEKMTVIKGMLTIKRADEAEWVFLNQAKHLTLLVILLLM